MDICIARISKLFALKMDVTTVLVYYSHDVDILLALKINPIHLEFVLLMCHMGTCQLSPLQLKTMLLILAYRGSVFSCSTSANERGQLEQKKPSNSTSYSLLIINRIFIVLQLNIGFNRCSSLF
jgi:hypothetical protein